MKKILSIIVPVYGDWESLEKNIDALIRCTPKSQNYSVYFVNDCGPDVDKLEKLITSKISAQTNFYYHRNTTNLGFVKNCNNAVRLLAPQDADVLLLNSDAIITEGTVEAMQQVLYETNDIAAVCPRSNSATIFSVPMPSNTKKQYTMEKSYKLYKKIRKSLPPYYISPIAHGFCMMIRRDVIDEHGLFDEIYGKGYGEENDFCMRIRQHGWKCAVANKAYVFHYKARSFSEEKRTTLVNHNEKILDKRYPEYRQLVRDYVSSVKEPKGGIFF